MIYRCRKKVFPCLAAKRQAVIRFNDWIAICAENFVNNWDDCFGRNSADYFYHRETRIPVIQHNYRNFWHDHPQVMCSFFCKQLLVRVMGRCG